ncbi:PfkB family carbohydrate kinase [Chloroflexota bacterium]
MKLINLYRLGWFSTSRDKAARDLLTTVENSIKQGEIKGEIKAEIASVFCSREPGEAEESDLFIRMVKDYNIPLICFSYQKFKARESTPITDQTISLPSLRLKYDREVMNRLQDFSPDLCVLAGHMLIVGKEMCQRYNMINLHPAAPGGPVGTLGKWTGWKSVMATSYIKDSKNEYIIEPSNKTIISALDTTGAGDAFAAGFLHGLLNGKALDECGHLGDIVAQFSISKTGARQGLPTLNELSQRYQELYNQEL